MKRTLTTLLCVIAAFALLWVIRTLYVVRCAPERAFFDAETPAPARTKPPRAATPTPTLSPEEALERAADADFVKERVNIMLLGFDESEERNDADSDVYRNQKNNYRSDVLMLLAVDFSGNRAHLISVPRDTYTPIYHVRGRWKINAAFAKGGAAEGDGFLYAQKTLEMLFGVPVPYYAGVNMEGLKALVDALGGVDYDVDVEIHLNGRTLQKGYQHLDGQQVLDYCRARKGISTDLGRADRQQRMLTAIFLQMQENGSLAAAPKLYAAVKDDVYTNLSAAQIAALASFGLRLAPENLERSTLAGAYVNNVYNASYYVLENKKLAALVKEEFGVTIKRESKYDLAKVRRDKAAAEAKKAAESTPDLEAIAVLPADSTGVYRRELLDTALARAALLSEAVEADAPLAEILRLRHALNAAVAAFLRENGTEAGVPDAFSRLVE